MPNFILISRVVVVSSSSSLVIVSREFISFYAPTLVYVRKLTYLSPLLVLDTFTYLLGDFVTVQSLLKSHYPTVPILDTSTGIVVKAYPKTAPDHIFLQGELENGALASLAYRKPGSCVDKTGFRWYISGVEGEILITTDEKAWQSPSSPSTRSIKVRSGNKEGEAEVINFTPDDDYLASNVPPPGTNTARQYEAFARGGEIVTFESSLKTHRLLEKIANSAGLSLS